MIHVVITEEGEPIGEMRIDCVGSPSSGVYDYSVEYAADSGGAWVDLKRRMLYGFNSQKYNVLALVSEALNVLNLNEMEMTDASDPGRMARGQRRARKALSGKADDSVSDHRSPFWRRQPKQQRGDAGGPGDGSQDRE